MDQAEGRSTKNRGRPENSLSLNLACRDAACRVSGPRPIRTWLVVILRSPPRRATKNPVGRNVATNYRRSADTYPPSSNTKPVTNAHDISVTLSENGP